MNNTIAGRLLPAGLALAFFGSTAAQVPEVGKYQTLELVFAAATSPSNPVDTYLLKLELTDPGGIVSRSTDSTTATAREAR